MTFWTRLLLILGLLATTYPLAAQTPVHVPRKVVALYDSVRSGNARLSQAHRLAAMPLNWLGLTVTFSDIRDGLPPVWDDPDVRGILTFYGSPGVPDPVGYLDWAEKVINSGRKFVILGEIGPTEDLDGRPTPAFRVDRFLALLGIRHEGNWSAVTYDSKIVAKDPEMIEFERNFNDMLPPFEMFEPIDGTVNSYLSVSRPGIDRPSHLAMISNTGGFVAVGYTHFRELTSNFTQWYLNPFLFFEKAFQLQGLPRLDTTTLVGRRVYYSHIDGDGWRNVSDVTKYYRDHLLAAEVALKELIAPFPDMPVTVAPIAADIDLDWVGTPRSQRVTHDLFAVPHVEPASHTYSHPFQWSFFEHYTADKEKPYMSRYDSKAGGVYVFELGGDDEDDDPHKVRAEGDRLKPGYSVPRAYANKPFELSEEIGGALTYIGRFAPADKPPKLVQWSGDTSPFAAALRAVATAGATNINGGDSRYDADYPSISWLAPTGRPFAGTIHVYASASNENTYTDLWTTRYFGYRDVITTLKNTEAPRRLKPINLYYHMYSASKQASLRAVLDALAYARSQEITPVFATYFARMVEGFFAARLEQLETDQWRIIDRGELNTVRIDEADKVSVDFARSSGLLGQRHVGTTLYIALDPDEPAPVVALGPRGVATDRPVLVSSRWPIHGLKITADGFAYATSGFGAGDTIWHVARPGRWRITAGTAAIATIAVAADGRLAFTLPPAVASTVKVSATRVGD